MKQKSVFTREWLQTRPCAHLNPHLAGDIKIKKGNKYKNNPCEVDGIKFDSQKEAKRYGVLRMRLKAGEIGLLELQKRYLLIPETETEEKCEYWADFTYRIMETGELVVEDVKSEATRKLSTYIMKRKLMLERYGISIKEI